MSRLVLILISILLLIVTVGLVACYWERGWLSIANVKDLFSIVASVGAVGSLLFIAFQFNLQSRLAKAANSQSFVNVASNFVLTVAANKELMEFYQSAKDNFQDLSLSDQARYRYLVTWWLTFYENLLYQRDCGLLDDAVYNAWMKDMAGFVKRRRVDLVWDALKGNYGDACVARFQPLVDEVRKEAALPAPKA